MDRDLVERAQRGDRDAYETLARASAHRLYLVAHRIVRDPDRADDATQQALITMWRELPSLRDPDRFESWTYRIVVRHCVERQRRVHRATVREIDLAEHEIEPRDGIGDSDLRDSLDQALRALPVEQRVVLVLHHYVGLPIAEIAAIVGVPYGTVGSRLYYATRAMRAALEAADRTPVIGGADRMIGRLELDRLIADGLDTLGPTEMPAGFADGALEIARGLDQRRARSRLLDRRAWPPVVVWTGPWVSARMLVILALVATALAVGMALIAGNWRPAPPFRNVFVTTDPNPGSIRDGRPVVLADGRVLVVGGWVGQTNVATTQASILDPATRRFTPTGDSLEVHDGGAPVLLDDGRVLLIAGLDAASEQSIDVVELFDPRSGTFRLTAPLPSTLHGMTVIRIADGRVLVVGGCSGAVPDCGAGERSAALFDPRAETWQSTGALLDPRVLAQPALLPDGRVLLVSHDSLAEVVKVDVYDPEGGRFERAAPPITSFDRFVVVARADRPPLAIGSASVIETVPDRLGTTTHVTRWLPAVAETYDPQTGRFSVIGQLPWPIDAAIERPDGVIVVAGSSEDDGAIWAGLFDPSTGTTTPIAPPARKWAEVVALSDGRIAFIGGQDPTTGLSRYDAEILE